MDQFKCDYCGKLFDRPVTSGHKRKCPGFLAANPNRNAPACLCGHESTSMTQMKRHRVACTVWKVRDKNSVALTRIQGTFQKKYGKGVLNALQVPGAAEKKAATMVERYGAENPFSKESYLFEEVQAHWDGKDRTAHLPKDNFARPDIKEKIREYWRKNHGVENPSQVPEIRAKQLATNLERYGDEQTLRVPEIRAKSIITLMEKYGVPDAAKSREISRKIMETNLKRYGVPWTTLGISREKQYQTQIFKYGTKFFASDIGKSIVREALLNSENIPKDGIRCRVRSLNKLEQTIQDLAPVLFYTGNGVFWKRLPLMDIAKNPDFIVPGPDLLHPFKGVKKVVEALGTYWHGYEITGLHRDEYESQLIDAYRHIGISCLIVWEDETWGNLEKLREKINLFLTAQPIPTKPIVPVNSIDFKLICVSHDLGQLVFPFLNEYHYAGFGRSSVKTCSFFLHGDMIAAVKFSHPVRQTIAPSVGGTSLSVLELDRFCIHPSYHVKNLASYIMAKSLRYIENCMPEIEKIVSFADPSEGHIGTIYKASNWKEIGQTSHSYFYLLPSGAKLNKKTLFNKAKRTGLGEREFADTIGATRISTPPKFKFVYEFKKPQRIASFGI